MWSRLALGTNLVNTATISAPVGVVDTNTANNSATDVDSTNAITDLAVTKTDGLSSAMPGDVVTYTIAVTNAGPSDAVGATLTDAVPSVLTGVTWTCVAVNGSCSPSGTGSLNQIDQRGRRRHGDLLGQRNRGRIGDRHHHQHGDRRRAGGCQ